MQIKVDGMSCSTNEYNNIKLSIKNILQLTHHFFYIFLSRSQPLRLLKCDSRVAWRFLNSAILFFEFIHFVFGQLNTKFCYINDIGNSIPQRLLTPVYTRDSALFLPSNKATGPLIFPPPE